MKSLTPFVLIVFITICLPTLSFSQTDNFENLLQQLTKEVGEVTSKKYTYEQVITYDSQFPYKASLESTRIDNKGKSQTQTSQYNFKDLDKASIRRLTDKGILTLKVNVKKKQKFIGTTENGERGRYSDELKIVTADVDNSRIIEELLEKIILLAKDIPPPAPLPATFEARIDWLTENITDAEVGGKSIQQKIRQSTEMNNRLIFEVEKEGKKETEKNIYSFNLADLKGKRMRLEVKNKDVYLEINASEKYIRHEKNGELQNFRDDFKIYVKEDIELGKNIVQVFQDLIEETSKATKNLASVNTKGNLSVAETVDDGKNTYQQKITGTCELVFETSSENRKGEMETTINHFNLDDLNPKSVEIKVSRKSIKVLAKTEKSKKLIQNMEEGIAKNYANQIEIRANSIEVAKTLKIQLENNITSCDGNAACKISGNEGMNFVKENVKDIEIGSKSFTQVFEPSDEENQWRFAQTEIKKKSEKEKAYIFNLVDIDSKKLDFEISKREVVVVLETKKREEIIKTYIDGEPDDYVNKIEILVADISTARNLVCALKGEIEKLK